MYKFFKRLGLVLGAVILISVTLSKCSLWCLRQGEFYKPSFLDSKTRADNYDYIILGASTGLTTLNTKSIDSILNLDGMNLSMDDTDLSSQYLMLQHFLALGKTTSYCVLAPGVINFNTKNVAFSDNDYRFLPYIDKDYVSAYYNSFQNSESRLLYLSKWFPVLGVGYYNLELFYPAILSVLKPYKHNRFDDKGNYQYPTINEVENDIVHRDSLGIEFTNPYVSKIKELCDLNGITLICYLSPIKNFEAKTTSKSLNIINHSSYLNSSKYFYDAIHVNSLGRVLISRQFAKDFKLFMQ